MATKRKRAGKWYFTFKRAGVLERPYNAPPFADEAEGDAFARRVESLLDQGIVPEEFRRAPAQLLRHHVREYESAQHLSAADRLCLRVVVERLPAALELRELTFSWASAWVTRMKREENLGPSTIRHHAGALRRCLDWLVALELLPSNPLRLLPRGYATYTPDDARAVRSSGLAPKSDLERDRRLQDGEEAAIREILGGAKPDGRQRALELHHAPALRLLFDLALETAMRLAEVYTLEASQIDLPRRTVFLDKTKNGDKRQVPLSSVAVKLLRAHLRRLEGERLFPWLDDSTDLARVTARLSRQFARIFDAAGCGDLHFHDLRHEATCRLYERTDLSDLQIAKILGWRSLKMALRYANLRGSTLAARLW